MRSLTRAGGSGKGSTISEPSKKERIQSWRCAKRGQVRPAKSLRLSSEPYSRAVNAETLFCEQGTDVSKAQCVLHKFKIITNLGIPANFKKELFASGAVFMRNFYAQFHERH